MSRAFDVNNGDDSDNESDNESGEYEEITHFVGSKNIGAAHEKKKTTKIAWNKHTLLFGKTRQCKFILRYYLAG